MNGPQNEKAVECANTQQPDLDSTLVEKAETIGSLAVSTQSVKRGRLEVVKRKLIQETLAETGGNMSRAAGAIGVDRRTLYRQMERFGITADEFRTEPIPGVPQHTTFRELVRQEVAAAIAKMKAEGSL